MRRPEADPEGFTIVTQNVLIAGCGDLGYRTARRLLAQGHAVWGLRRRPPPGDASGLRWLAADMTRPDTLGQLPQGITQLVLTMTPDARDEAAYRAAFLQAPRNLLKALDTTRLQRILFVSSSAVYGDHQGGWVDEQTPEHPPGFNGRVLLDAERELARQAFRSIVLRLSGLYGPGRTQLLERIRRGIAKAPRTVPHWSNRIHIEDAAAAVVHLLALPDPDALYLGSDSTPLPLHELYEHLARELGASAIPDGPPPPGVGSKRLSNRRLLDSGLALAWPDSRAGYAALVQELQAADPDLTS